MNTPRLILPRFVVEQYLGVHHQDWDGRRAAYEIYRNSSDDDLLSMAREMGYTGLDVAISAYPYAEWQRLRGTRESVPGSLY